MKTKSIKDEKMYSNNDMATAILMLIAAAVSGVMSIIGANSVFNNIFISIAFGVVVQGSIFLSLWSLYGSNAVRKSLLTIIWACAATFSIGSAFLYADKSNETQYGASARKDVNTYTANLNAVIAEKETSVKSLFQDAENEKNGGNGGPSGAGPKYRKLLAEANSAQAEFNLFKDKVTSNISLASRELKKDKEITQQQVLTIFQKHLAPIQAMPGFEKISAPAITNYSPTTFSRLKRAVSMLSNDNKNTDALYTLLVASMMEILSVLIAICRIIMKTPPSEKRFIDRMTEIAADIAEFSNMPVRISDAIESRLTSKRRKLNLCPEPKVRRNTKETTNMWHDAITGQASVSKESIASTLERILTTDGLIEVEGVERVNSDYFKDLKVVQAVMTNTGVLEYSTRGHKKGKVFDTFIKFALSELAKHSQPAEEAGNRKIRLAKAA